MPAERPRFAIPFGPGLDRETGLTVVQPSSFEDLSNWLLHQGKMLPRAGFDDTVTLRDGNGVAVTHIVAGFPLRSERIGVVVSYQEDGSTVWVHRIDPDATLAELLGEWENDNGWEGVPKVSMAESYGRVFMAHDTASIAKRAQTVYYDPVFGAGAITGLEADFGGLGLEPVRFRGVIRHLKYLFGWGFGSEADDRPEYVRSSVPGDPTTFQANHFFIAGDRRDPVLVCRPAGNVLLAQKETETHHIFGSGRDNFGIDLLDPLYGVLDTRLAVNFGRYVLAWSAEGPRVWDGAGPSSEIAIPLDLAGPDPAELVAAGEASEAFAFYVPDLRIVAFVFGRRVYALTVRVEGDWKWSYWELGFDPLCAFTLFTGTQAAVAPPGYPEYDEANTVPAGTTAEVAWINHDQLGDETVEVWMREAPPVPSGTTVDRDGVILGATDFSEYPQGEVIPDGDGITHVLVRNAVGSGEQAPNYSLSIVEDASEGWVLMATKQDQVGFSSGLIGFAIDGWDGVNLIAAGAEMLCRFNYRYPNRASGSSNDLREGCLGVSHGMRESVDAGWSTWDGALHGVVDRAEPGVFGDRGIGQQMLENGTPAGWSALDGNFFESTGEIPLDQGNQRWLWSRTRFYDNGGTLTQRWKVWLGALEDEPSGWNSTSAINPFPVGMARPGFGVLRNTNNAATETHLRIAYIAFTTDYTQQAVVPPTAPGAWFLAGSFAVSPLANQDETVEGLEPGTVYDVALRYRKGLLYNAGASSADPATWPTISQGSLTTTIDPPEIIAAEWSRTSDVAEQIELTITPLAGQEDQDIIVWRRPAGGGAYTELDTIPGPHVGDVPYPDPTIAGETAYEYAVSTGNGALGDPTRVWSGPAGKPVFLYQNVVGGGYRIGFTPGNVLASTELYDAYDDAGGVAAQSLRATAAPAATEVNSGTLVNVPPGGLTFLAKLRHVETAFTIDDHGEFSIDFNVTVPESE